MWEVIPVISTKTTPFLKWQPLLLSMDATIDFVAFVLQ
jgi:hypothetical protein